MRALHVGTNRERMDSLTATWQGEQIDTTTLVVALRLLAKYVKHYRPTNMVVCWDGAYEMRKKILPSYKEARVEHDDDTRGARDLFMRLLGSMGVVQALNPDIEADDLIAWYVQHRTLPTVILSGDKDLLQLVSRDRTRSEDPCAIQCRIGTGDDPSAEEWGGARLFEEHGCTPKRWAMVKALAGDPSDGVPGLTRVGIKTAVSRLSDVNYDWDAVFAGDAPKAFRGQRDLADTYLSVVDLDRFLPPPPPEEDPPGFIERITTWEPVEPESNPARWAALERRLRELDMIKVREDLERGVFWR
jgi:5'-3' exonuclease